LHKIYGICRHFDIEGYERDQLDENITFLRRSTRQRKFLYDTFNQHEMIDESSLKAVEQDRPDEQQTEARQQQPQLDVQAPSDTEVTVDSVWCRLATDEIWIRMICRTDKMFSPNLA